MKDITGQRFGNLVAQRVADGAKKGTRWLCLCDCGKTREVYHARLVTGDMKSCGCGRLWSHHGRHGEPLYRRWKNMRARCADKSGRRFRYYGSRGITVCERWDKFENFAADMGPTFDPSLTLDRIDVNGPYSPENCRWVTWKEQQNNRRSTHLLTFHGITLSVRSWGRVRGISPRSLYRRLAKGWSVDQAIFTPPRQH